MSVSFERRETTEPIVNTDVGIVLVADAIHDLAMAATAKLQSVRPGVVEQPGVRIGGRFVPLGRRRPVRAVVR